jgi:hypothetical protein
MMSMKRNAPHQNVRGRRGDALAPPIDVGAAGGSPRGAPDEVTPTLIVRTIAAQHVFKENERPGDLPRMSRSEMIWLCKNWLKTKRRKKK